MYGANVLKLGSGPGAKNLSVLSGYLCWQGSWTQLSYTLIQPYPAVRYGKITTAGVVVKTLLLITRKPAIVCD